METYINQINNVEQVEDIKKQAYAICEAASVISGDSFAARLAEQQEREKAFAENDNNWPLITGYFGHIAATEQPWTERGDRWPKEYPLGTLKGGERYVGDIVDSLLEQQQRVTLVEIGAGFGASLINIAAAKREMVERGRLVIVGTSLESVPESPDAFQKVQMLQPQKDFLAENAHLVHFIRGGREEILQASVDVNGEELPLLGNTNVLLAQNSFESWSLTPGYDTLVYGSLLDTTSGVFINRGEPLESGLAAILGYTHALVQRDTQRSGLGDPWISPRNRELKIIRDGNPTTGDNYMEEMLGLHRVRHPEVGPNTNDTLSYVTYKTPSVPPIAAAPAVESAAV